MPRVLPQPINGSESTLRSPERHVRPSRRPAEQGVMSLEQFNEQQARSMSEETWRQHQRAFFEAAGFDLAYHTHNSERSDAGWPDDVYMHKDRQRFVIVESKRQTGKLTADQVGWLDAWAEFRDNRDTMSLWTARIEIYVTRPMDRDGLVAVLFRPQPREDFHPLHQWCLSEICERCQADRKAAGSTVPARRSQRMRRGR